MSINYPDLEGNLNYPHLEASVHQVAAKGTWLKLYGFEVINSPHPFHPIAH